MAKRIFTLLFILTTSVAFAQVTLDDIEAAVAKIKEKEKTLLLKEQELTAKEEKLNSFEKDLVKREEELTSIRKEIDSKLKQLDTASNEELNKLAKLFASTKPKQAAAIIIAMDVERSAGLLSRISAMTAGKIMAEVAKQDPAYASKLTVKMSGDKNVDSLNQSKRQ